MRMEPAAVRILDERPGWLAVDKPAGLPTEAAPGFPDCLLDHVAKRVGLAPPALHAVNRLDVVVSGVVLVVTDRAARQQAAALMADRGIERRYVGLVTSAPRPSAGCWSEPIGRGRGRREVGGARGESAATAFATVAEARGLCVLGLSPETGRTHQIRAHARHAGCPIVFDRRYGGAPRLVLANGRVLASERIGLHAGRVRVPLGGDDWTVVAPIPDALRGWWAEVGGEADALDAALVFPLPPCEAG